MKPDQALRLFFVERPGLELYLFTVTRDYEGAQDILQEAAVAVTQQAHDYDPSLPFGPWVGGIVRRKLADWWRSHARDPVTMDPAALDGFMPVFQETMAEESLEKRGELLERCFEALGEEPRRIMDLRYLECRSCESIARIVKRSVQGVYAVLKRAKDALRHCVERRLGEARP